MFDFELYWDDSGTHDNSPIAIAACYVATQPQWGEFVRNWDKARQEEGFDWFHMADFMQKPERGIKPYCDWSPEKRKRVYFRLASIINTRVRMGFGFGIPTEAFNRYAPQRFKDESASDAFIFAVQCVFSLVGDWYLRYGEGKAVQYIFEDRKGMAKVHQIWEFLKEHPEQAKAYGARPDVPDGITFQSPKFFKPLQSADILAWNTHTHMRDVVLPGLPDRDPYVRPYFRVLRCDRPTEFAFLTDEQVKEAFDEIQAIEQKEGHRGYLLPRKLLKRVGGIVLTADNHQ